MLDSGKARFPTTHWTLVLDARTASSRQSRESLAILCETYWYPLYAYVRRRGYQEQDAEDLTQEFFARLLERHDLNSVDRSKGRFRSFLLATMKHFLANEWDRAHAQKRGGGQTTLSLDVQEAESRYIVEPADESTPESLFERSWALTLLDQVLNRLREELAAAGKLNQFNELKVCLTGDQSDVGYATPAKKLGMSEGAIKVTVHRMRARYRDLLREEIAHTVAGPEEIEDELRDLLRALST